VDANVILLILGGFLGELLDSSIGMLYGTILSPVLIIAGYDPLVVVPSLLLTQAVSGFIGAIGHHRLRNVDFSVDNGAIKRQKGAGYISSLKKAMTRDSKVVLVVSVLGVLAAIIASLVATSIPKAALKTYIGVLVLVMGAILVSRSRFTFSWNKILGIGAISAFNKGLSGGGFGPIVTAGQMISGRASKSAIGATTLAEMPICMAGFLAYLLRNGMSTWNLVIFLGIGAIVGSFVGPHITAKFKSEKRVRIGLGILVIALGIWTLAKTWLL
jgi:uncharacterized membrane protein YfcA